MFIVLVLCLVLPIPFTIHILLDFFSIIIFVSRSLQKLGSFYFTVLTGVISVFIQLSTIVLFFLSNFTQDHTTFVTTFALYSLVTCNFTFPVAATLEIEVPVTRRKLALQL